MKRRIKRIKHSKYKNTGFLFELLTRQVTLEILNNQEEKSKKIIREFFSGKTELSKELRLFQLLLTEKHINETKAEKFIDLVLEAHDKIDYKKLSREKYNLVKRIKENFDIDNFFASPIKNYKTLASVHKLFEAKKMDVSNIKDIFRSRNVIIEYATKDTPHLNNNNKRDGVIETYRKQEQSVRLLTYKMLIETFNKKYSNLNDKQKDLLKEYINNVNNTSKFKEYFKEELKTVVRTLRKLKEGINDEVTVIKLNETINVLKGQKIRREIQDSQVSSMMIAYELIKEIRNARKRT